MGGCLTKLDAFTEALLKNEFLLAMHRNARHPHQVFRKKINGIETVLWTAASSEGGQYIAVFNLGEEQNRITLHGTDFECNHEEWESAFTLPPHGCEARLIP